MRVEELMTAPVETVPPSVSADEAWTRMRAGGIRHLVVVDRGRVAGVVSSTDLGGRRGAMARKDRTVGDLMTAPAVSVEPAASVRRAANLMRGRTIGCLVVADADRPVGIVTTADLLDLIGRGTERPVVATRRWTLKHRAPHTKRHTSAGVW
ncbi:MAG: CBS domain-containing protein [Vicinamibacterales bacterium]